MSTIGQLDINRNIVALFFNDTQLKTYMGIPDADKNNIVKFRDQYYVNAYSPDALVINEIARLVWRDGNLSSTRNPNVKRKKLIIEIYTKTSEVYTVDAVDRLKPRHEKISQRVQELLKNGMNGFKFEVIDETELISNSLGYRRYMVMFEYSKIFQ